MTNEKMGVLLNEMEGIDVIVPSHVGVLMWTNTLGSTAAVRNSIIHCFSVVSCHTCMFVFAYDRFSLILIGFALLNVAMPIKPKISLQLGGAHNTLAITCTTIVGGI